jgi:hypothetical protein
VIGWQFGGGPDLTSTTMDHRIAIEEYLVWSTLISAFLLINVAHIGMDIMLAYPVVMINMLILLVFDKLKIHRNHMIAIAIACGFSLLGMLNSSTPANAVASQIAGISVMSIYYFSALTTFGVTLQQWFRLYVRLAYYVAVIGLLLWPIQQALHSGDGGDARLKSFYSEPSFYIYMTLPALGYCLNAYMKNRKYGWETLTFVLSYFLADSSLGFIGLMLVCIFAFARHVRGWQVVAAAVLLCGLVTGLYFVSANFQLRVRDTAMALATQELTGTNDSTWALLSNLYVVGRTVATHPVTGVGIGGYRYAYDSYIGDLTGLDLSNMPELNRDDANSMFLRVIAELGVPGLLILCIFLLVCARVRGSPYREIRNALLPYLLVRMGRLGNYFTPELYFFTGLYVLNYMEYRKFRLTNNVTSAYSLAQHTI